MDMPSVHGHLKISLIGKPGALARVDILDMKFTVAGCNYGECKSECGEGCEER